MRVAPWQAVLDGDFTRNLWMADAVLAGLRAADLAAAGLAPPPSSAYAGLSLLGEVDVPLITAHPDRWLCGEGYLKLHSACSYTHPAVDLVLALRGQLPDASAVQVRTGSLSTPLSTGVPTPAWPRCSRSPSSSPRPGPTARSRRSRWTRPATPSPDERPPLDAVVVEIDESLDRWLPDRRVNEVSLSDGTTTHLPRCPQPVGDASHFPLAWTTSAPSWSGCSARTTPQGSSRRWVSWCRVGTWGLS